MLANNLCRKNVTSTTIAWENIRISEVIHASDPLNLAQKQNLLLPPETLFTDSNWFMNIMQSRRNSTLLPTL